MPTGAVATSDVDPMLHRQGDESFSLEAPIAVRHRRRRQLFCNFGKTPDSCACCGGDQEDEELAPFEQQDPNGALAVQSSSSSAGTSEPASCNKNILRTQSKVLAKVRERRLYLQAKDERKRAERELRLHNAKKKVLGSIKDDTLRNFALRTSAPVLPAVPDRPGHLPRLPPLQFIQNGPSSPAERASKIDFHQHCMPGDEQGLQELLKSNQEWNIEQCVLLSLRLPRSNRQDVRSRNDWVLEMAAKYEGVVPFVTVIEDDEQAPQMFLDCLDRGARGLKLIGWHSNYIKQFDYDLRHPAMMGVFRIAASRHVPVLLHLWVGYGETKRNYLDDLEKIFAELPDLRMVLAHFGLGFDPETLPGLTALASRHRNLFFDTSLYGSFCELWFSRASNQVDLLRDFVLSHPRQILFGTDVFGSRRKRPSEYADAVRASIRFVERELFACAEFKRTPYFQDTDRDKYGPVVFDPLRLHGLGLGSNPELLERILIGNAKSILSTA